MKPGQDQLVPVEAGVVCTKHMRICIDLVRILFATMALVATLDPAANASVTLKIVAWLFGSYSIVVLIYDLSTDRGTYHRLLMWIDAVWVLLLFAFSHGVLRHSEYLYLPLLFAGVSTGPDNSIKLAIFMSLFAFAILALQTNGHAWSQAVLIPSSLLAVGYLVTAITRRGTAPSRAAALASAVTEEFEPNRGVDVLAALLLDRVASAAGAEVTLVAIMNHEGLARIFLGEQGALTNELPPTAASLAPRLFAVRHARLVAPVPNVLVGWFRSWRQKLFGDSESPRDDAASLGANLTELVERPYLLIAVAGEGEEGAMRLLLGRSKKSFDEQDLELMQQVMRLAFPVFRNACLIERLTGSMAEIERTRLGRDLHDSAIQPYIGLKFAIEALARKVSEDDPLAADIGRLLMMMQNELGSIRSVIKGLRENEPAGKPLALVIRALAKRLSDLYDLQVAVEADESLTVGGMLSADISHMVSEALSNVRRHTRSRHVQISLARDGEWLVLTIHNDCSNGEETSTSFTPKSLSSRATALGGYTSIHADAGGTIVTIRLPLH